jgi:HlyD family secretion protein
MTDRRASRWWKRGLGLVLFAAGAGYGSWHYREQLHDYLFEPPPRFETALVSRGQLTQVVTASGQLNPVTKVEVGSLISGNIQKLFADFNTLVKGGQVIAQIDPATYEANYIQAEGNLASAKAALELAQVNEQRAKVLRADKLNPQADYDKALADLHQAEAQAKINEGALKKAKVDLDRCTIYAPIDGMVISRNVNVGQTVAASLSAPVLFLIANDLSKMQIETKVAEADIGQVEVGQEVSFTVDAFPDQTFHGKVVQIRNAPITEQNVVTYDTIIEVNNAKMKLKPGMTANVSIIIAHRDNAIKLPNAALRFRLPSSLQTKQGDSGPTSAATTPKTKQKSAGSGHKKDKAKGERSVWLLPPNGPVSTNSLAQILPQQSSIKIGISDGSSTEVLEGLSESQEVIIGIEAGKTKSAALSSVLTGSKKKH